MLVIREGTVVTAVLSGELDEHSAPAIRRELDGLIASGGTERLIFDLGGVTFMDSSGIGVLLGRYRRLKAAGAGMGVINANAEIERLLRMSGVYTLCTERSGRR